MAIGMKVMICFNLSTAGDIANLNGTRGTIRDFILDPREEALEMAKVETVKLMYPPAMILFEPDGGSNSIRRPTTPTSFHRNTKQTDIQREPQRRL
jgi:hypothetical protein